MGLSTAASLIEQVPQARILVLEQALFPRGASTRNAGFACFGSLTELWAEVEAEGQEAMCRRVAWRWEGLQRLCQRLGKEALAWENHGGYELILRPNVIPPEKLEALNTLLMPLFGKAVFSDVSDKIAAFGFDTGQVGQLLWNPFEAQLHAGRMIAALQAYVQERGVRLLSQCEVKSLEPTAEQQKAEVLLTNGEKTFFFAPKVAVCTNAFAPALFPVLNIRPGRGQVLITESVPQLPFHGTFHFEEGYYYFRNVGHRILLGGGRNLDFAGETTTEIALHKAIQQDLEEKLFTLIAPHRPLSIAQRWAGIMGFTPDRNPIVQSLGPGLWVGAGLNGMGVAIGTWVGHQLAQQMKT
ncbi:MAG: FAD-binding oxidoreductase [Microscillaceae bacterium]|nr:FAD-binding oxidoreductase [Microscillaceae bacterium]